MSTPSTWVGRGGHGPARLEPGRVQVGPYRLEQDGAVMRAPSASASGVVLHYSATSVTQARLAHSVRYADIYRGADLVFRYEGNTLVSSWGFHGGTQIDNVTAIAVDASGAVYLAGSTESPDMISSSLQPRSTGVDAFVLKIDPTQNRVTWATYLGGAAHDEATAIAVHPSGGVVVSGFTSSSGFPVANAYQGARPGGSHDAFLVRLDASGAMVFGTYFGGSGTDKAYGATVTPSGEIWIAGETDSSNFPRQLAISGAARGGIEAFASRFSAGGTLLSSTTFGGAATDRARAIATDSAGEVYVTGSTESSDFPTAAPFQAANAGAPDAFVGKIAADGTTFRYSSYLGGPARDVGMPESGTAIAVDASGAAWVGGVASSLTFPLLSPLQPAYGGGNTDAFLARVTPAGSLAYSSYVGGNGSDEAAGVVLPADGSVVLAGSTTSTDLPLVGNIAGPSGTSWDGFVVRLNASGSTRLLATYLSGAAADTITGLAARGASLWIGGNSASTTLLPSGAPRGLIDGYFAELKDTALTTTIGGPPGKIWQVEGAGCEPGWYSGTREMNWTPGTQCTVTMHYDVTSPDMRNVLAYWSDGSTVNPRVFTAAPGTWSATYRTEYRVQTSAGTGGTAAPGLAWIAAGATVQLVATPAPGYVFAGWSGGFTGNPATLTVTGPVVATAAFSCGYALGSTLATVLDTGATVTVPVTTGAGCTWTAISNASWISVSATAAAATVTVSANSATARTGTVTIAGQTFTVNQSAIAAVPVTFSPPADRSWIVSGDGCQAGQYTGPRTLSWNTGAQCSVTMQGSIGTNTRTVFVQWSDGSSANPRTFPVSSATWVATYRTEHLVQTTAGSGGTTTPAAAWVPAGSQVQLAATPIAGFAFVGWSGGISGNPATVTVTGPISVTATFACDVAVAPNGVQAGSGSSVHRIAVTSACSWSATSDVPWISVTSGAGEVVLTIEANAGTARSGVVNIGNRVVNVTQAAVCTVTPSQPALNSPSTGQYVTVSFSVAPAGCAWHADSTANWAQVYPLSGTGNGSVSVNVFAHFGLTPRSGTVSIGNTVVPVNQAGATGTVNERFAGLMYYNFLGRLGAKDEIAFHAATLTAGVPRKNVAYNFYNAEEFNRAGRFIAGLYVGLLNRDAEFGGWLFQRSAYVTSIVDQAQLVSNFLTTPEYTLKFGKPDDNEFVRLLYRYILRREAGPAEVVFQASQLKSITRVQLAMNFLNGQEFRIGMGPRLTAFLLYSCLLLRDGSVAEREAMAAKVAARIDMVQLIDSLLSSPEFENALK